MKSILDDIKVSFSYGQVSLAAFIICGFSGILLAIPYDIDNPAFSISQIMLLNPAASFIRNLHFWSAQVFLVFSLIHIWDHFNRNKQIVLKKGVWLRLTIGVLVIFMAMLTGFLLKGDADTKQAWRILDSLILEIPILGNALSFAFLGTEDNLQLIYIHHIATLTIFLAVITFEHSRKIWPFGNWFFITLLFSVLLSYFFTAPLHEGIVEVVKGPWYFVGFQEVLHWLTYPWISLVMVLVFLALIYIVPYYGKKVSFFSKRTLLIVTVVYILLTITGSFFRGENWNWVWPWSDNYSNTVLHTFRSSPVRINIEDELVISNSNATLSGTRESCLICHDEMVGFTLSHNPSAIGCYSCHGGNPYDIDKDGAHIGMRLIPGNFHDAEQSCGTVNCHPDIVNRRESNLMANLSGMISVDRYVFNEQDNPDLLTDIHNLGNNAADEHLRNLCVVCHLGNPKTETGPVTEKSRGGGCLACHINYDELATTAWMNHLSDKHDTMYLKHHPSISMQVTNDHCFGCHSRSARISPSYEGWHETQLAVDEVVIDSSYRVIEDHRVFTYIQEDVHHKLGLSCIDCHNSYELMGDGNYYAHQENQVTISCEDCHFENIKNTITSKDLDSESAIIASMRFGNITDKVFLATHKRNTPIINAQVSNDTNYFFTKKEKKSFLLSAPSKHCTRGNAHDNLDCNACHASWAPSCIGCHNEYDPDEPGYYMYRNEEKTGSWVEYVGEYNAGLPALGVRRTDSSSKVIPVIPGMVLTIDVGSFSKELHDSLIFQRLFAPSSPHTTVKEGRSCVSCHLNPEAIGYGKGELLYNKDSGRWIFDSKYSYNPNDHLPEDAWVGFLDDRNGEKVSTRSDVFPFTIEQQKTILTVGACLSCHEEKSEIINASLINFDSIVSQRSKACVMPVF